ncbi:hypothetical protein BU14_0317s0019 [Porphyra umbilicalis]|uniref:Uncharacterized protein n=1 Tax=Porphyra umbilicalis TaxID=2786 RepID=A0A1X6NZC2_PORUM|nr:hypothetical protein BU14_0317s0019 [Porphyra umbilicalis]|eukprot:OSX73959.1 hypothetical protein BU14_0317s0019 [Porphyra umbilicalis]
MAPLLSDAAAARAAAGPTAKRVMVLMSDTGGVTERLPKRSSPPLPTCTPRASPPGSSTSSPTLRAPRLRGSPPSTPSSRRGRPSGAPRGSMGASPRRARSPKPSPPPSRGATLPPRSPPTPPT